jgi:hypothetical protein
MTWVGLAVAAALVLYLLRSALAFSAVGILLLCLLQRVQSLLPAEQRYGGGRAEFGLEHRGQLRDQHELAGLQR